MRFLGFALMAPTLLVMLCLYWAFPRQPRHGARRAFDVLAVVLSLAAAIACNLWGYSDDLHPLTDHLGHRAGDIWPQVLAALYAYAGFSVVLFMAIVLRARLWPKTAASEAGRNAR